MSDRPLLTRLPAGVNPALYREVPCLWAPRVLSVAVRLALGMAPVRPLFVRLWERRA